ncbi:MAG: NADH-quinone oxidoreductase subunit N [Verrucomicrobia bacterium]|nr:NADH-quinone oxidoreductase subunit N [Verrucomicrobiota bacterium]MBS0637164.1 NADH-quinone oxidoreductase subunit N [Verrucomicrobiota bacterium]
MNLHDLFALSPLLVLFGAALLVLLLDKHTQYITFCGLVIAAICAYIAPAATNPLLTEWLVFDNLARFFSLLFIAIGLGTLLISSNFFARFAVGKTEFHFLLLSSIFGLTLISSSKDFLTLFIGLETLSIALYVLCCYVKTWKASPEAAFKYFLLGSISTSILLFGIAMLYGATGSTKLSMPLSTEPFFLAGMALVSVSLLFKAAIVPFHIWTPDVYAGAPTPVTALMAVGTKAGAFAALIRVMPLLDHTVLEYLAFATLIFANFVALRQREMRRFFAYSGISHAGFLLLPLIAGTTNGMLFYLVVYAASTLGAFACLSVVDTKEEGVTLDDLKGLFYSSPLVASFFSLCLLTLAGIPPTVGFFAKLYLLQAAYSAGYTALVIVALLTTILAAYYYLRIIAVMCQQASNQEQRSTFATTVAIGACSALIVLLSIFPDLLT